MNRLTIAPGLRRLWRDQHEIQFGLDPARAVVIHLTDPVHARLFELLDGTRSERAVLRDAASLGIASRDAFDLLTAVRDAGLVVSAGTILPDSLTASIRARLTTEAAAITNAQRRVPAEPTSSHPPSPAEVLRRRLAASALAGSGVGHVDTQLKGRVIPAEVAVGGLGPGDVGAPRGTATATAIMRTAPDANTRRLRDGMATFVIQAGAQAAAEILAHGLARRRLPHLLIEERDDAILVGPLVVPGRRPACTASTCIVEIATGPGRHWPRRSPPRRKGRDRRRCRPS